MRYTVKYVDFAGNAKKYHFNAWDNALAFIQELVNDGTAFKLVCKKA